MRAILLTTNKNGTLWRIPPEGRPIKVMDPSFVQERVPTPKWLDYVIASWIVFTALLAVGLAV